MQPFFGAREVYHVPILHYTNRNTPPRTHHPTPCRLLVTVYPDKVTGIAVPDDVPLEKALSFRSRVLAR